MRESDFWGRFLASSNRDSFGKLKINFISQIMFSY